MLRNKPLFLCLLAICFIILPSLTWAWSGKVISVADGNTITVLHNYNQVKVRLYGIDTPESDQAFGKEAEQFTSDMVFRKEVYVERMAKDRYGRQVGLVFVDKTLVNEELVKVGLAWVYWKYCHHPICEGWKNFQLRARMNKRGLWADPDPIPPWQFRRKKKK